MDAGVCTCIGSPVIDFVGIAASTLLGEFIAVNGPCAGLVYHVVGSV